MFFHIMVELMLMLLFIELGNLLQTEGPVYDRLFSPMVVSRKGTLSLA